MAEGSPQPSWRLVTETAGNATSFALEKFFPGGILKYPPQGVGFPKLYPESKEFVKDIHNNANKLLKESMEKRTIKGLTTIEYEAKVYEAACLGFYSLYANLKGKIRFDKPKGNLSTDEPLLYPYCNNGIWHGVVLQKNPFEELTSENLCRALASIMPMPPQPIERKQPVFEDESKKKEIEMASLSFEKWCGPFYRQQLLAIVKGGTMDLTFPANRDRAVQNPERLGYANGDVFRKNDLIVVEDVLADQNIIRVSNTAGILDEGSILVYNEEQFTVVKVIDAKTLELDDSKGIYSGIKLELEFAARLVEKAAIEGLEKKNQEMEDSVLNEMQNHRKVMQEFQESFEKIVENVVYPTIPLQISLKILEKNILQIVTKEDLNFVTNTPSIKGWKLSFEDGEKDVTITEHNLHDITIAPIESFEDKKGSTVTATVQATVGIAALALDERQKEIDFRRTKELSRTDAKELKMQEKDIKREKEALDVFSKELQDGGNELQTKIESLLNGQNTKLKDIDERIENFKALQKENFEIIDAKSKSITELSLLGKQLDKLFADVLSKNKTFETIVLKRGENLLHARRSGHIQSEMEYYFYNAKNPKKGRQEQLWSKALALVYLMYLRSTIDKRNLESNFMTKESLTTGKFIAFTQAQFKALEEYQKTFNTWVFAPGETQTSKSLFYLYAIVGSREGDRKLTGGKTVKELLVESKDALNDEAHAEIESSVGERFVISGQVLAAFTTYCRKMLLEISTQNLKKRIRMLSTTNCGYNAQFGASAAEYSAPKVMPFVYRLFAEASVIQAMKNTNDGFEDILKVLMRAGCYFSNAVDQAFDKEKNRVTAKENLFKEFATQQKRYQQDGDDGDEESHSTADIAEDGLDLKLYEVLTRQFTIFKPLGNTSFEQELVVYGVVNMSKLVTEDIQQSWDVKVDDVQGSIFPPKSSIMRVKVKNNAEIDQFLEFDVAKTNQSNSITITHRWPRNMDDATKTFTFEAIRKTLDKQTAVTFTFKDEDLANEEKIGLILKTKDFVDVDDEDADSAEIALTQKLFDLNEEYSREFRKTGEVNNDVDKKIEEIGLLIEDWKKNAAAIAGTKDLARERKARLTVFNTIDRIAEYFFFYNAFDSAGADSAPPSTVGMLRHGGNNIDMAKLWLLPMPSAISMRLMKKVGKLGTVYRKFAKTYGQNSSHSNYELTVDSLVVECSRAAEEVGNVAGVSTAKQLELFVRFALDTILVQRLLALEYRNNAVFKGLFPKTNTRDQEEKKLEAEAIDLIGNGEGLSSFFEDFGGSMPADPEALSILNVILYGKNGFTREVSYISYTPPQSVSAKKKKLSSCGFNALTQQKDAPVCNNAKLYFNNFRFRYKAGVDVPYFEVYGNETELYAETFKRLVKDSPSNERKQILANFLWYQAASVADTVKLEDSDSILEDFEEIVAQDDGNLDRMTVELQKNKLDGFDDLYLKFFFARLIYNLVTKHTGSKNSETNEEKQKIVNSITYEALERQICEEGYENNAVTFKLSEHQYGGNLEFAKKYDDKITELFANYGELQKAQEAELEQRVTQIAKMRQLNQAIGKRNKNYEDNGTDLQDYINEVDLDKIKDRVRHEILNGVDVKLPKLRQVRNELGEEGGSDSDGSYEDEFDPVHQEFPFTPGQRLAGGEDGN